MSPPDEARLRRARDTLEGLLEGIGRFWDERVIDSSAGGYRLGHDASGRYAGDGSWYLVTQARVAWYFSRLARSPYGEDRHLEFAAHGIRFLRERMWDERHGGFRWRVERRAPGDPGKHLYGQAFGIFALAGFSRSAADNQAAGLARELFELIDAKTHDERFGGYLESRRADWSAEPAEAWSVLGHKSHLKTSNAHLHLMEACTELSAVCSDELVRERLRELVDVMCTRAVDPTVGSCGDAFMPDWSPVTASRSSYGHDLENAWLLGRAARAANLPDRPAGVVAASWDTALTYGFDERRGGFFESGPRGRAADRRAKVWWVQAEGLVGALSRWRETRQERYLEVFERTLGWIIAAQADRVGGDWHACVDPAGRSSGDKSGAWKDPYHQGRAVLECLQMLEPPAEQVTPEGDSTSRRRPPAG